MRYALLLFIAFFAAAPAAHAQETPRPTPTFSAEPATRSAPAERLAERVEHRVDVLAKTLQLSPAQTTKVRALLLEQARAGHEMRREPVASDAQRHTLREQRRATDEALRGIFSEEQYKAYQDLQERERATPRRSMERR